MRRVLQLTPKAIGSLPETPRDPWASLGMTCFVAMMAWLLIP